MPGEDDAHKMTEVDADGREWTFDPATGELTPGEVTRAPKKPRKRKKAPGPKVTTPIGEEPRTGGWLGNTLGTILGVAWIVLLCWIVIDCG